MTQLFSELIYHPKTSESINKTINSNLVMNLMYLLQGDRLPKPCLFFAHIQLPLLMPWNIHDIASSFINGNDLVIGNTYLGTANAVSDLMMTVHRDEIPDLQSYSISTNVKEEVLKSKDRINVFADIASFNDSSLRLLIFSEDLTDPEFLRTQAREISFAQPSSNICQSINKAILSLSQPAIGMFM